MTVTISQKNVEEWIHHNEGIFQVMLTTLHIFQVYTMEIVSWH